MEDPRIPGEPGPLPQSPAHIVLETPRMVLRRFTPADAGALVALDADPEVMRFITGGRGTPREVVERELLPRYLAYYERASGHGFWAAEARGPGAFLGWFHLRPPEGGRPEEPELGYRLRRAAWGHGYATEGSRALIRRAFTELGAERVFAGTMAVNTASRRVMEKAGMRLVRTVHEPWPEAIEGAEHGDVEYAITRAEWERQQASPGVR